MSELETMPQPKFKLGETVLVASRDTLGHCRTPWYLRGRTGIVCGLQGAFHDPERLAYHKPGLPAQILYKVRFQQRELWSDYPGPESDELEADIYEYWLQPVRKGRAR